MQSWSTFIRMSGPISGVKNMYSSWLWKYYCLFGGSEGQCYLRSVLPQENIFTLIKKNINVCFLKNWWFNLKFGPSFFFLQSPMSETPSSHSILPNSARATFKNPKIALWIRKNLEVQPKKSQFRICG